MLFKAEKDEDRDSELLASRLGATLAVEERTGVARPLCDHLLGGFGRELGKQDKTLMTARTHTCTIDHHRQQSDG